MDNSELKKIVLKPNENIFMYKPKEGYKLVPYGVFKEDVETVYVEVPIKQIEIKTAFGML
jgi:hypothetical protein